MGNHQSLYRRWRPQRFREVLGQDYTVKTLQSAVASGRLHHAYLFAGPRGTGKTSVARIFAKAVNCESPQAGEPCNECPTCQRIGRGISLDVLEIDGASNRGIDQIRQLREEVNFVPAETRYKVYIIDEVHMLTNEAFNALLKTLEEPPRRVIFIFATTEPHKLPPTVASRCQAFEFKPIPPELIDRKLREIAQAEGIAASPQAIRAIARWARGSFRDAEVLLEQLASYKGEGQIEEEDLLEVMGLPGEEALTTYLKAVLEGDASAALAVIARLSERGKDPELFLEGAVELCRDWLIAQIGAGGEKKQGSQSEPDFPEAELLLLSDRLLELKRELRFLLDKRVMLEVGTIKIIEELKQRREEAGSGPAARRPGAKSNPQPQGLARTQAQVKGAPISAPAYTSSTETKPGPPELEEKWRAMLEAIKKERVAIYAFLAEGRPLLREGRLRIEYPPDYKFHKESLEKPENRSFLQGMIRKFYGDLEVELAFASRAPQPREAESNSNQAHLIRQKVEMIKRSFRGELLS